MISSSDHDNLLQGMISSSDHDNLLQTSSLTLLYPQKNGL